MILFRIEANVDALPQDIHKTLSESEEQRRRTYISRLNVELVCAYSEHRSKVLLQVAELTADCILAFMCCPPESTRLGILPGEQDFLYTMQKLIPGCSLSQTVFAEITISEFLHARDNKYEYEMNSSELRVLINREFHMDFMRFGGASDQFEVTERLVASRDIVNKATAKAAMKKLLPSASLAAELRRIFSAKHPKERFYGIPVHYKLTAQSEKVAEELTELLVRSLYINNRILSQRVTILSGFGGPRRLDSNTIANIMDCSQDSVVAIHLNGDVATESEYASQYHRITDILAEACKKFSEKILFLFVECTAHPGMAKQLLGKVGGDLDILTIEEGVGESKAAEAYFRKLLTDSNMDSFYDGEVIFQEDVLYSASEVRGIFHRWRSAALKNRVYCAYQDRALMLHTEQNARSRGSAYDELQRMVGLWEVKGIVSDIIAAYKVQKLRNQYYNPREAVTKHMIFTGNPGTAKTSVARLLADILKENEILSTGAFVECGRADLVGKYVGWTARIVQEKFREAHGGILFIDEAYSLVDSSSSFGDEAINTIVQEMENRRSDVLVVFAGYPEKMERFLEQNEGLRSRIAFHIAFPDYTPDELMGILDKILKERHFKLTDEGRERAFAIFQTVYKQPGYGNGRFVRNLFEQALNRQAARILRRSLGDMERETLFELQADDFDTPIAKTYQPCREKRIGFS